MTTHTHAREASPVAKWLPVSLMLGSSLISYLDRNALAVLSPMILGETGMTAQQYGFALLGFSVAYAVANPAWGYVLDRKGLRVGMAVAVTLWSLASFGHAVIGAIAWMSVAMQFALARTFLGAVEGATFPGAMRTAGMTLPPHQQARGISIGYTGGSMGAILTPLIVTPIALAYGWRAAFWVTGIVGLIWVGVWIVTTRAYPSLSKPAVTERRPLPDLSGTPIWAFLTLYSLGAIPLAVGIYAAPIYLAKGMGVSQETLGYWLWLPPLGWELGYLFWAWIADKTAHALGRAILALAIGSGVLALVPFAPTPMMALLCFFVSMFVAAGFVMLALKYGLQWYPRDQALLAGLGAGAWSGLVAILMPIVGTLFDANRFSIVFLSVACAPLVGAALWAVLSALGGPPENIEASAPRAR